MSPPSSPREHLLLTGALAALYAGAAWLGFSVSLLAEQVTVVWPPTGLALAAVLIFGRAALAGILLGAFIANFLTAEPLLVAAGIGLGNTLEALAGAALLTRAGFDRRLARPKDVVALLLSAAAAPVVSATIGVFCLVAGGVQPAALWEQLWGRWWIGDALGALMVAPLILVWASRPAWPRHPGPGLEATVLIAGLILISAVSFAQNGGATLSEYVVFPFLVWGAVRFGPAGSVTVSAAIYALYAWATHTGLGPFANAGAEGGLILLQVFMAVVALTGLMLGAVTEQRRLAQESAQLSEQRLLFALQAAHAGVWDWNIKTGERRRSADLENLLGVDPGHLAMHTEGVRRHMHEEDRPRIEAAIEEAIRTRQPYRVEFRVRRGDGTTAWLASRGQVLTDAQGEPARMIGVAVDISELKSLEEEMRRQAEALAETDRRKSEFLAMLSHELRNPLAPIVHAVELLKTSDPRSVQQAREVIARQAGHLSRLVNDLLDIARISRGAIHLELRPITLKQVVNGALDLWQPLIAGRAQTLRVFLPPGPVWLKGDETRLIQVLGNLLHNAAKFTPDGGEIVVAAEQKGGWLSLSVRDTGAGIAPDMLGRVFDIFVQGARPLDRPQGGLGLGLALVQRLVELHGGNVSVMSAGADQGSEFVVRLPVAMPAAAPTGHEPASGGAKRILVVEDNADAREMLCLVLQTSGHEVRAAADGASAIEEARRFRPQAVLLDIGLPGMDGYQVAKALRALEESRDAILVAISGYGQSEDRERARSAGFDHHLVKPVDLDSLNALLSAAAAGEAR